MYAASDPQVGLYVCATCAQPGSTALDRRCPLIGYVSAFPASAGSMVPPGEPSGVGGRASTPRVLDTTAVTLFEAEWERGMLLSAAGPADDEPGPDASTRDLLTLLASGLTDEGIARALGWSTRTTQRRIRALMDTFGAGTRFQLGMSAQSRGWL